MRQHSQPAGIASPAAAGPGEARHPGLIGVWIVVVAVLSLVAGVAVGEAQAWAFLAQPAERWLSQRLARQVSFGNEAGSRFRLHLLGGIHLDVAQLSVAGPDWAAPQPMVVAQALQLQMRWRDALAWRPGRTLVLQSLVADKLALDLHREADGRASWQLGMPVSQQAMPQHAAPLGQPLRIQALNVRHGSAKLVDALRHLDLNIAFAMTDASAAERQRPAGLTVTAQGSYRKLPLQATLQATPLAGSALPALSDDPAAPAVPVTLALHVGRAQFDFDGHVHGLLGQRSVRGSYRIAGPSLAAVGDPLGITLPQTRAFAATGRLVQSGRHWDTVVDQATVGRSRLAGEFSYQQPPLGAQGVLPLLAGRLRGATLMLQDLGPAVGGASGEPAQNKPVALPSKGRMLPSRPFDLPALRAMNANIVVALDQFDFGTPKLQPVAPLTGHLVLQEGLLVLDELDARLAQGRLSGRISLDGRQPTARWDVDLQGRDLRLEQWVRPVQRPNSPLKGPLDMPYYATGLLGGRLTLTGQGRSTADLLASADGRVQLQWRQGTLSHLLVEAAGLDVAQGLGVLLMGDKALKVSCGVGDLQVKHGRVTPQVLLVDTADSTLWIDGNLSLDTERLALVAHVHPKDWSPLALRTPLHINGSLGAPELTLEKGPLLRRLVPAALLAMLNPLAALLPLMDAGEPTGPAGESCTALASRLRSSPTSQATARSTR